MTFQEKIVILRKKKGLTQDEFASAVGVSRQAVYKWESGKSYPEAAKLLEIKILFGISIDDLLDENYEVALPEKKKRKRTVKEETILEEVAVSEQNNVEAPALVVENAVTVPVAEEKAEEPAAVEAVTPEVKAEPAEDAAEQKKVGFFGRLFGRK